MNPLQAFFNKLGSLFSFGSSKEIQVWYTIDSQYAGYPIYLRYLSSKRISQCSRIALVTIQFDSVEDSGLPKSHENAMIEPLDQELCEIGKRYKFPVLVETFAGKRKFYLFSNNGHIRDEAEKICMVHSNVSSHIKMHDITAREFLEAYQKDMGIQLPVQ